MVELSKSSLLLPMALVLSASLIASSAYELADSKSYSTSQKVPSSVSLLFSKWKAKYGKHYSTPSANAFRLQVFYQNYLMLDVYRRANPEATYGLTFLVDQTDEEMRNLSGEKQSEAYEREMEQFNDTRNKYDDLIKELKSK